MDGPGAQSRLPARARPLPRLSTHTAADAVEDRARETAKLLEFEGWTADWRQAVEHPEVEAVSIATLNHLHREVAVDGLVRFENGERGTIENSRTCIGPHVRNSFEVNGTRGALSWDSQRLNELRLYRTDSSGDQGYRTVFAAPGMGNFHRFQPGAGISMGYDDLKVTEAYKFLTSIAEDRHREPGMREIVSAMRVVEAMDRTCGAGGWEAESAAAPAPASATGATAGAERVGA